MTWRRRHEPSDDSPSVTNGRWIIWTHVEHMDGTVALYYSSCDEYGEPDYRNEGDYRGNVAALRLELEKVAS